jgi:hypothetical protein
MSIPLDRLYHHIENLSGDNILIYRWVPHGSKKISDLQPLYPIDRVAQWDKFITSLPIICHDQEPLTHDSHTSDELLKIIMIQEPFHNVAEDAALFIRDIKQKMHIYRVYASSLSVYDRLLLCHSEKNSVELAKFEANGFIGVYYWSHALIARDWFRFAEHDNSIANPAFKFANDFLIYNRAWQGTREYRLKFTELLLKNSLIPNSNIKFNPHDNDMHYTQHTFTNQSFAVTNERMERLIQINDSSSSCSADYVSTDYHDAGLEVVLETLFDDSRLHLTEKSLRPIACGKPFILAATPNSLQYLRDYGFKTFDGLIDESYDTIQDPLARLVAIVTELKRIASMPFAEKQKLWEDLHSIADYNKKLFFSKEWESTISDELKANLAAARAAADQYCAGTYWRKIHTEFKNERGTSQGKRFLDNWLSQRGYGY